jgi:polysaccharide export outer membrane protein
MNSTILAATSENPIRETSQSAQPAAGSPQAAAKQDKQATNKKAKQNSAFQSDVAPEDRMGYRIGVEDELQISVWREPELSTAVVVRPDGMITLPLLNDVKVVGLKTEELQTLLTEKLKGLVNEPQITVIVHSIHSRKVSQGTYPLNGELTVLDLLAGAGGLGVFAKANSIYILREQNGKKVRIPFHYKKTVEGKSENIVLYPGDVVVVP